METEPKLFFTRHVFCCTNERPPDSAKGCCASKGSHDLREYMKARVRALGLENNRGVRINAAGCLDRCALGPVMVVYPEGVWYHYKTRQDIDEIINVHLIGGQKVERLLLYHDR